MSEPYPIISNDAGVQSHYEECRQNGCNHRLAEMLALRAFPHANTDREFLEGRCNGKQFERQPRLGERYRKMAEAAGVSTTGKVYLGQLADFPGDPKAWVSDRSDVLRVAREKNLTVDGSVKHRGHETEPMPKVDVAEDLVDEYTAREIAENPEKARNLDETRHEVKERLMPKHL